MTNTDFTPEEIYEIRELICDKLDETEGNISENLTNALYKMSQPNKDSQTDRQYRDSMLFFAIGLIGIVVLVIIAKFM